MIEYGHYLRDAKGNTAKLYTTWSFTERALSMIPEEAGDITGIVNKRYKCDVYDGRDQMRRPVEKVVRAHPPRVGHHQLQGPGRKPPFEDRHADRSVDRQCRRYAVGDGVRRTRTAQTFGRRGRAGIDFGKYAADVPGVGACRCTAATWDAVKNAWLPAYGNTKGCSMSP